MLVQIAVELCGAVDHMNAPCTKPKGHDVNPNVPAAAHVGRLPAPDGRRYSWATQGTK